MEIQRIERNGTKGKKPVVNLVTPVAQALEMVKVVLKQKREDSIRGGGH